MEVDNYIIKLGGHFIIDHHNKQKEPASLGINSMHQFC